MKGYWNQLRPLEKRLVVGIGTVVFIVLNAWFVVPHFSDWGKVQRRKDKAENTLSLYDKKISQTNRIVAAINKIQSLDADVAQEEQSTHFASTIVSEGAKVGVVPLSTTKIQTSTNQNFFELSQTISVQAKEQQIVDFLFNLGEGTSLIRVRDFNLHPDQSRQMLAANIKLAASYQRRMPARGSAAPAARPQTAPAAQTRTPAPTTTNPKPVISTNKASSSTNRPGLPVVTRPVATNKPALPKKTTP